MLRFPLKHLSTSQHCKTAVTFHPTCASCAKSGETPTPLHPSAYMHGTLARFLRFVFTNLTAPPSVLHSRFVKNGVVVAAGSTGT